MKGKINPKHEIRNSKQIQNSKLKIQNKKRPTEHTKNTERESFYRFGHLFFGHWDLFRISDFEFRILSKRRFKQ